MEPKKFSVDFGGKELIIATGQLANQANGAVVANYGGTTVLATCVMSKEARDVDYIPLTVNYEEKLYAAGKISKSRFIKREGRTSEEAILTGRMIDRCLRPLFDQRIRNEIQMVVTVLSFDGENDPDIPSLVAASTALMISDIPWAGPIAGLRVGKINQQIVFNPTYQQREESDFDVVAAGTSDQINMIEGEVKEKPEEEVLQAIDSAQKEFKKVIDFQHEVVKDLGKPKTELELKDLDPDLVKTTQAFLTDKIEKAVYEPDKKKMKENLSELQKALIEQLIADENLLNKLTESQIKTEAETLLDEEVDKLIHHKIMTEDKRPDGRQLDQVRSLSCQISILPRIHGSGLFQRGDTQALSTITLGPPGDEQTVEGMEIDAKKRFFHHYYFPPFSVGETGRIGGPGRREIGHGALAEKALKPVIPNKEDFPYTVRVVSEILSSNGSSSMASVSGSSLALMDAGIPVKASVSGIAMGLITDEQGNYKILTDIQGPEDHHGDMDCKVAGTKDGVTACQMDVKIKGVNIEILTKAFEQAKKARLHILGEMDKAIDKPRPELSPHAPRILTLKIDPEKIGLVIGQGGKTINEIIEVTGATSIDIDDDGLVAITAPNTEIAQTAYDRIHDLTREIKEGETFNGKVVKITDFGAFVELTPNNDGLIHISELSDKRVEKVEDVLKEGDIVPVKVKRVDDQGRIGLSYKDAKKN